VPFFFSLAVPVIVRPAWLRRFFDQPVSLVVAQLFRFLFSSFTRSFVGALHVFTTLGLRFFPQRFRFAVPRPNWCFLVAVLRAIPIIPFFRHSQFAFFLPLFRDVPVSLGFSTHGRTGQGLAGSFFPPLWLGIRLSPHPCFPFPTSAALSSGKSLWGIFDTSLGI